jgi:alcohol dehydrogenase class IV
MTPELREARDELHDAARALSREVSINRRILREALAHGDTFARTLAGAMESPAYGVTPSQPVRTQATNLLDRRI